ncbi:MAG TPA: polyprenol phosphomannose-dependent alpha 1,6 mannosyltransferase MptB [Acidimicrobiales bacterium]|nr:polyprenol phosphomannose-dependent alpha 1,6 mannosyltransferase MptB [Acidimicrobiales bacterium]
MGVVGRAGAVVRGFDPSSVPVLGPALDRLTAWDEAVRTRWPFNALVGPELEPDAVEGDGSRLLVRPALLGFVAITAITLGVLQPRSPFVLKEPGAWFFGVTPVGRTPSTHWEFLGLVAVYGGLVLFMRVWYGLIRTLSKVEGVPVRKLALVAALWIAPLLLAPPLFSRDVYSYAAQGEMMSHHISPYHYGPGVLGATPSVDLVDHLWLNTPVPYGPLFMQLDGVITSASMHHELADVLMLRLLALVGVALMAAAIPSLARSLGRDPSYAFTVAVLNPVTILHLVGGAHNDALMLGFLMCGLALAKRGRPVLGIVLCALAAAVKVPGAIGILYIGWDWLGTDLSLRARVRPVLTAGLIGAAVMGALSLVTGLGWSWVLNLATPGTVRSWVAPATGIGILLTDCLHLVGLGVPLHAVLTVTRVGGALTAAGAGVWLLLRSDRIGALRAMGLTMLLIVALGPVVQPWYLSWGLVLLAPVATGKVRTLIVASSVLCAFIGLPAGRQLVGDLFSADPLSVAVSLLACLAILTVPLSPFDRQRRLPRWRRRGPGTGRSDREPSGSLDYVGV